MVPTSVRAALPPNARALTHCRGRTSAPPATAPSASTWRRVMVVFSRSITAVPPLPFHSLSCAAAHDVSPRACLCRTGLRADELLPDGPVLPVNLSAVRTQHIQLVLNVFNRHYKEVPP